MFNNKHRVYFLVRSYKAFQYFNRCIDSIFGQNQKNYIIIFIDDASGYQNNIKQYIRNKLKNHIVIFNKKRLYSLRNAYEAIHTYVEDEAIIINVDGDDFLINNDTIDIVTERYNKTNCNLTYGNCVYYNPGNIEHGKTPQEITHEINRRFPSKIEKENSYRKYHFLPLHLRTWKASIFKRIDKKQFLKPNGDWIRFCEDQAIFYPMLETGNGNYQIIEKKLYAYNIENPMNDDKANLATKLVDEVIIRRKNACQKE